MAAHSADSDDNVNDIHDSDTDSDDNDNDSDDTDSSSDPEKPTRRKNKLKSCCSVS